jgi:pyruvate/2-oxoglutarate dehydrogenase complex dihydrolipoamide dehydrogenase (E3) component
VKKKVSVIGAGIAGMEAARVAALRGHTVSLYEKEQVLGGQLQIAAKAPGRQDMAEPVRYYETQFRILGVDVHLGSSVDEETVLAAGPDAVIVATGGLPSEPTFPGAEQSNVVTARDVLSGKAEAGRKVVLLATDRGMESLTTAEFLAERGSEVEILVPQAFMGFPIEPITFTLAQMRLYGKGVVFTPTMDVKSVQGGTVTVSHSFTGEKSTIEGVDTVVVARGGVANDSLCRALKGKVGELYSVGQCVAPRKMLDSTLDGLRVGRMV